MKGGQCACNFVVVVIVILVVICQETSGWTLTPNRRDALRGTVAGMVALATTTVVTTSPTASCGGIFRESSAWALGEGGPRMVLTQPPHAPLRALLPAAQARLLLEHCRVGTASLSKAKKDQGKLEQSEAMIMDQLKSILVPLDDSNNHKYNHPFLSGRGVRAAMNLYTANLSYGSKPVYDVTDPQWKKDYIRTNDGLPSVKKVIVADLDLRDLYRNKVELLLDDAAAELYSASSCDVDELLHLMQQAADSFDQWLGMIPDVDVQEALQTALEGKSTLPMFYESYYAGFVPPRNNP